MQHKFKPYLDGVHHLDGVHAAVDRFLRAHRASQTDPRVGYVAGIITSDGPEHIARNNARLARYADYLRSIHPFPLFACPDIFTDEVFAQVGAQHLTVEEWLIFWRKILRLGHVTDVFMTPRWEVSLGAQDEYKTAQALNLRIHLVPDRGF